MTPFDAALARYRATQMGTRTVDEIDGFRAGWAACIHAAADFVHEEPDQTPSMHASKLRVHLLPKRGG